MREDFRLFNCARCRAQVRICSHCDRGQIYCSRGCAARRRSESIRRAGQRYQRTPRGRVMHAAREARHRVRVRACTASVTHQGTPRAVRSCIVSSMRDRPSLSPAYDDSAVVCCTFCGHRCRPFSRRDFIRARRRYGRRW